MEKNAGWHVCLTHAFSAYRYSLAIRQEVCAVMALNMLRRWLNGEDITSEHGWIDVVESLTA
ncbi:molybdopterin-binding protein [Salmonella enterica]